MNRHARFNFAPLQPHNLPKIVSCQVKLCWDRHKIIDNIKYIYSFSLTMLYGIKLRLVVADFCSLNCNFLSYTYLKSNLFECVLFSFFRCVCVCNDFVEQRCSLKNWPLTQWNNEQVRTSSKSQWKKKQPTWEYYVYCIRHIYIAGMVNCVYNTKCMCYVNGNYQ